MQKSKHPEHFFLIIYLVYLLDKTKVHNGLPTKVQSIKRKKIEQWYINFPAAIAQAMEFERRKTVSGFIENKGSLGAAQTKSTLLH